MKENRLITKHIREMCEKQDLSMSPSLYSFNFPSRRAHFLFRSWSANHDYLFLMTNTVILYSPHLIACALKFGVTVCCIWPEKAFLPHLQLAARSEAVTWSHIDSIRGERSVHGQRRFSAASNVGLTASLLIGRDRRPKLQRLSRPCF